MAIKRLCRMCSNTVSLDEKYCEIHKGKAVIKKREQVKQYDLYVRDKDAAAFYSSKEWKRVRAMAAKRDNYLCLHCLRQHRLKRYNVVDHIKPVKQFPELKLSLSNLQSLCHACHRVKTEADIRLYNK